MKRSPPSTQEKLTGLTPVLPHLPYTGYTHTFSLSHCFHLGVKWIPTVCQNAPPISGCDSLSPFFIFPLFFLSFSLSLCATHVPFCFHRKMPRPHCEVHKKTFPGRFLIQDWFEIPSDLIFYMTTWMRSKSETYDSPCIFKTNHSHPWNPQEKGLFMKFLHTWHTNTHTYCKCRRGCSIKYWYLLPPHDFTCQEADSLFL